MPPLRSNLDKNCLEINSNSSSLEEPEDNLVNSSPDHENTLKLQDIKEKLVIASNITEHCKAIKQKLMEGKALEGKFVLTVDTIQEYTNLPKEDIQPIFNKVLTRDRSFAKCLKDIKALPATVLDLLADDVRTISFKLMCEENRYPIKKQDLLNEIKKLSFKYSHRAVLVQKLVRNKLLKYEFFSQINRYLLSEHPEKVYERTLYLNRVKHFRMQEKHFYYVEVKRIETPVTTAFIAGLAASPLTGQLDKFFTKDTSDLNAKKWLQQRILQKIPKNSIIILAQPRLRKEPRLSPASSKSDLRTWLYLHDIPHEDNAHTAILYDLYAKYKNKVKQQGLYDHVFLNAGFTVVNFPTEWRSLNYFMSIWSDVNTIGHFLPIKPEVLKQKILNATQLITNLKRAEEELIERETKMMKEDIVMEKIIENIREMAREGQLAASDFPKGCAGKKTDNLEMNISKYVIE